MTTTSMEEEGSLGVVGLGVRTKATVGALGRAPATKGMTATAALAVGAQGRAPAHAKHRNMIGPWGPSEQRQQ